MAVDPMEKQPDMSAREVAEIGRESAKAIESMADSAQELAGEVEALSDDLETAPAVLAERGAAGTARIESDPELAPGELAADPEAAMAKREIDEIIAEQKALADGTRVKAGGLLTRMRKFARVAGLAGAISFLEACAAAGAPRPAAAERLDASVAPPREAAAMERPSSSAAAETGPPASPEARAEGEPPSPEKVKADALERLKGDEALRNEVGPENFQELVKALEWFDEARLDAVLADLAGADPASLDPETARDIRFYSEKEIAEAQKTDKYFFAGSNVGKTRKDRIEIRAKELVGPDGKIAAIDAKRTLVHEMMHVYTTPGEAEDPTWEPEETSNAVYEGVTELMAQRAMEKMGEKPPDQSYAGGNFAAAYLLERVVGTRTLAADYVNGDVQRTLDALKGKFGAVGATRIMGVKYSEGMAAMIGAPEGLATAHEILVQCEKAGIDPGPLLAEADREGIKERIIPVGKAEGLFLSKEMEGGKLTFGGLVEDKAGVTEHSPPLRMLVSLQKGNAPKEAAKLLAGSVRSASEHVERMYKEFQEVVPDPSEDPQWHDFLAGSFPEFDVRINVGEELADLRRAYDAAPDDAAKRKVQEAMAARAAEIARETMAALRAAAAKERRP